MTTNTELVRQLREKHGGYWGEYDRFPVNDWRYAVDTGETRLGYWEWVAYLVEGTNA